MRRLVRLDHWPFAAEATAAIHWLRSPWYDLSHDQWRATAVLRLADGEVRELDFPWGALPWMRLGQWLREGAMVDRQSGQVTTVFVNLEEATLVPAGEVIAPDLYPLNTSQNEKENCWVCPSGSWTVILPVMECLRAFFVPTRAFAYGLLEPTYLERILARIERHPNRLKLFFTDDIPLAALTPPVVLLTARLVQDASFLTGWRAVYQNRCRQAPGNFWVEAVPLETSLPDLRSRWRVRGVRKGGFFLVLEILGVEPAFDLPFEEIEFEHPNLVQSDQVAGATKVHHKLDQPNQYKMHTGPAPASGVTEPAQLPTPPVPVLERKKYRVRGIRRPRPTVKAGDGQPGVPSKELVLHAKPTAQEASVTAADIGVGGQTRAAEFIPLPSLPIQLETEDGLTAFAEAIQILQQQNPEITASWLARELPEGTAFALVKGRTRKYVAVGLTPKDRNTCWILEIGRPDDFSISTLLFRSGHPNPFTSPEQTIATLILEGLHSQGGWNRTRVEALENQTAISIGWVKHYDQKAEHWAQRLVKKVLELIGA